MSTSPDNPPSTAPKVSEFRTLWAWVILGFVILICAWTTLFWIALSNQPEVIDIQSTKP